MKNNNAILFFVKYPEPGQVKTRLAAGIGAAHAIALYQCFLDDLSATLANSGHDVIVCYSPNTITAKAWAQHRFPFAKQFYAQRGSDLGERILNAFEFGFHAYQKLLLIGSDSPHLPAHIFNEAFDALEEFDAVIGPSTDGGYYLIGFRHKVVSRAFQNINWSTNRVLTQTKNALASENKSVHLLPETLDIDEYDDLELFLSVADKSLKSVHYIINHLFLQEVTCHNSILKKKIWPRSRT